MRTVKFNDIKDRFTRMFVMNTIFVKRGDYNLHQESWFHRNSNGLFVDAQYGGKRENYCSDERANQYVEEISKLNPDVTLFADGNEFAKFQPQMKFSKTQMYGYDDNMGCIDFVIDGLTITFYFI